MEHQLFKVTQNAVIKNASGGALIVRHATGKWLLPGGKINKGETRVEGLRRELSEEVSLANFRISKILDIDTWNEGDDGYCVITYLVETPEEFAVKLGDEHKEYAWIHRKDLDKYDFWNPKIAERLKKAFD